MTLSINFAWIKNLFQFIILSHKADQSTDHETEEACGFVTMLKNVLIFQIRSTPSPQNDLQALILTPRKHLPGHTGPSEEEAIPRGRHQTAASLLHWTTRGATPL